MTAHAALIAEKLQGAHERRQRGEDKDMGKDEGVWAEAARQIEQALTMVRENVERGLPDEDAPQSNAVTAERVVELERRLADACADRDRLQTLADKTALAAADRALGPDAGERVVELERQLAQAVAHREEAVVENERVMDLLHTAYVVREVPWSDVAAGMMTIARDGTAWMVEQVLDGDVPISFRLRNGEKTFTKTPNDLGETVRVLVPYVTPEQAEKTVADGLGAVRA